jgi:hypothetical protein
MKTSMRAGAIGWAFGALALVVLVAAALTAMAPRTMRAAPGGAATGGSAVASEVTPGLARAEADTLDLQLD